METDHFYLELALKEAERAGQEGTYPIGALVVSPEGVILSRGRNRVYSAGDYDHFYRHLDQKLDLSFVRAFVHGMRNEMYDQTKRL